MCYVCYVTKINISYGVCNMLDELITHFGTQAKLARFVGVTRVAVVHWKRRGVIPRGKAYEIEVKTNGLFKAKDLIGGNENGEC